MAAELQLSPSSGARRGRLPRGLGPGDVEGARARYDLRGPRGPPRARKPGEPLERRDTYTETVEGFFGNFKSGLTGAHHAVSHKWLQGYLNEWTWRYNRRESAKPMFRDLLESATPRA